MKLKTLKNEQKAGPAKRKRSGGFALLFSVLVSSLLLTIGLSIFSIALKELSISSAARQSIYSFYAADSGRECLKYWDTRTEQTPSLVSDEQKGGKIYCGGQEADLSDSADYSTPDDPLNSNRVTFVVPNMEITDGGQNFSTVVVKEVDRTAKTATTTITSVGYDSPDGDRTERKVEQSY